MRTATLRTVGGSTILAIPKVMLEQLGLSSNDRVAINVEGDKLVIQRRSRSKYKLADLLAECDADAPRDPQLQEWVDSPAVGEEQI